MVVADDPRTKCPVLLRMIGVAGKGGYEQMRTCFSYFSSLILLAASRKWFCEVQIQGASGAKGAGQTQNTRRCKAKLRFSPIGEVVKVGD